MGIHDNGRSGGRGSVRSSVRTSQSARKVRQKLKKIRGKQKALKASNFPVATEIQRIWTAWLRHGVLGMPWRLSAAALRSSGLENLADEQRIFDIFGENVLALFDELGPLYGKAGQVVLSRLSPRLHVMADTLRLTRLYGKWPPLPFDEVQSILDKEIPRWRTTLEVDATPLGVASMAQVHAAVDQDGREWVIKIIKPKARERLMESVTALERVVGILEPFALTLVAKRSIAETRDLCRGFRREMSLARERDTIEKVREKLKNRRQKVLHIPDVNQQFSTDGVLAVERFRGVVLSDVVAGKVEIPVGFRQKLAKTVLQELLVQVFELGLFHADPHAGNLILMEDGSVGLFDWGLAGELGEMDRKHIASLLRAVISVDLEQLIDALVVMAEDGGKKVSRPKIEKELQAVMALVKKRSAAPAGGSRASARTGASTVADSNAQQADEAAPKKISLQELIESCLRAADRLGIPVPEGLLLMAKSLMTIEGLARGIDPKVSMLRVATPVLFRAARPGFKDFVALAKRLPKIARQYME